AGSQHKMDDAVSLDADHGESRVPFVGKLPPDKTHETDQQPSPWRTQWPILQRHCEVRVKRNKAPAPGPETGVGDVFRNDPDRRRCLNVIAQRQPALEL